MTERQNNRIRQGVCTTLGVASVTALLVTAVLFPGRYCAFLDKKTLNQVVYTDIEINTYETTYASFAEKLQALTRASVPGSSLHAVQVNEPGIKRSRKELTNIVNRELRKLYQLNILEEKETLARKKLTQYERYTIYETNQQNNLKGISIWKLVYNSRQNTITLYLDEEYHKIYCLMLSAKTNTTHATVTSALEQPYDSEIKSDSWLWFSGILRYYKLSSYNQTEGASMADTDSYGIVAFKKQNREESSQMTIYSGNLYDEYDNPFWILGIPLEQMIQF